MNDDSAKRRLESSKREGFALKSLNLGLWAFSGVAKRLMSQYRPRPFHNQVLRVYLSSLGGDVVNVSGWEDSDRQGGFYRGYFGALTRYAVTNIEGDRGMPGSSPLGVDQIYLDLEQPLDERLVQAFDVAFSHTVLEHIFDIESALENIAAMSRDVVVTVVPFSQSVHYSNSYGDYLRVSPFYLKRFFEGRGFEVLLSVTNDQGFFPVYLTMIVSRKPDRHREAFRHAPLQYDTQIAPDRYGRFGRSGLDTSAE